MVGALCRTEWILEIMAVTGDRVAVELRGGLRLGWALMAFQALDRLTAWKCLRTISKPHRAPRTLSVFSQAYIRSSPIHFQPQCLRPLILTSHQQAPPQLQNPCLLRMMWLLLLLLLLLFLLRLHHLRLRLTVPLLPQCRLLRRMLQRVRTARYLLVLTQTLSVRVALYPLGKQSGAVPCAIAELAASALSVNARRGATSSGVLAMNLRQGAQQQSNSSIAIFAGSSTGPHAP